MNDTMRACVHVWPTDLIIEGSHMASEATDHDGLCMELLIMT